MKDFNSTASRINSALGGSVAANDISANEFFNPLFNKVTDTLANMLNPGMQIMRAGGQPQLVTGNVGLNQLSKTFADAPASCAAGQKEQAIDPTNRPLPGQRPSPF